MNSTDRNTFELKKQSSVAFRTDTFINGGRCHDHFFVDNSTVITSN